MPPFRPLARSPCRVTPRASNTVSAIAVTNGNVVITYGTTAVNQKILNNTA